MKRIKNYMIEVFEYGYTFDEKEKLLDYFDQNYGTNYRVMRSGPKIVSPGRCHKEKHHMIIHVRK